MSDRAGYRAWAVSFVVLVLAGVVIMLVLGALGAARIVQSVVAGAIVIGGTEPLAGAIRRRRDACGRPS